MGDIIARLGQNPSIKDVIDAMEADPHNSSTIGNYYLRLNIFNYEEILQILIINGECLEGLPDTLKNDRTMVLTAIRHNKWSMYGLLRYLLSSDSINDDEIVIASVENCFRSFYDAPNAMKRNPDVLRALLDPHPKEFYNVYSYIPESNLVHYAARALCRESKKFTKCMRFVVTILGINEELLLQEILSVDPLMFCKRCYRTASDDTAAYALRTCGENFMFLTKDQKSNIKLQVIAYDASHCTKPTMSQGLYCIVRTRLGRESLGRDGKV